MPDNRLKPVHPSDVPDPHATAPEDSPSFAAPAKPAPPAAAKARTTAPAPTHYLVLHGAVGQWEQGAIITAEELAGIDIDRLLSLGAIQPTQEPIKDVEPAADDGD